MRTAVAVVTVILAFGIGSGSVFGESDCGWLYSLRMFDAQTGWAVEAEGWSGVVAKGAVESVVRTTDGGLHWKDVTPYASPGQKLALGQGRGLQVDWLDSLTAWVAVPLDNSTLDSLFVRTVDGGRTWKRVSLPAAGQFYFVDTRNGWLMSGRNVLTNGRSCPCGEDEDIYRTADGGETWSKVASTRADNERSGLPFAWSKQDIIFLNTMTGWITGTPVPGDASHLVSLYVTHDGGHTWHPRDIPPLPLTTPYEAYPPTIQFFTAQDGLLSRSYRVPNRVYPVAGGVVFYVTHDGGATWTPGRPPYETPYTSSTKISELYTGSSFADINHGWAMNYGGTLYVTSDGGRMWTTAQSPISRVPVGQIDFISSQIGWATGQGNSSSFLQRTVDGGRTWESLPCTISRH